MPQECIKTTHLRIQTGQARRLRREQPCQTYAERGRQKRICRRVGFDASSPCQTQTWRGEANCSRGMMLRRQSGTKAPPPPERLPSQDKYSSKRVLPLLAASIGCIVAASLILRTTMASALQTDDVVTCQDQHRLNGRAVPGTTLADDGHCVRASSLDAGVCVEDAADWRGIHRRRCLPSLAVIGARAASGVPSHCRTPLTTTPSPRRRAVV